MAVIDAEAAGGATAGGAVRYRPGTRRRPRRLHRRLEGRRSTTTSRGSTSRRCPRTSRRSGGCSPTCWPPTRSASGSRPAREDEVVGFASASVREGLWFLAMLFVLPGTPGARHRPGAHGPRAGRDGRCDPGGPAVPGPDDAARHAGSTPGACAPTPPSRSRTACTRGAGWCPGSRSGGCSARCAAGPRCPRCRAALEAVAFESVAATEPDGAATPRRRSSTTSTGR